MGMLMPNPSQLGQPGLKRAVVVFGDCCSDSSAVVVPRDDNILHLEDFHCVLDDRKRGDV